MLFHKNNVVHVVNLDKIAKLSFSFAYNINMKVPLSYQITEFDCCSACFLNIISYLYKRSEIKPEILKKIYFYTLDLPDRYGNICQGGTSRLGVKKLVNWLNRNTKINCKYLEKESVDLNNIKKCIYKNGVCLIRCYQDIEHYVIITKIKNRKVYIFDPYYIKKKKKKDKCFKIVLNKPFLYNRVVKINRIFEESKKDFSLGSINERECVLFNKCKQ